MKKQTYKQRCLEAIDVLIKEYKEGNHIADAKDCSLCLIYYDKGKLDPRYTVSCDGCPNNIFREHTPKGTVLGCFLRKFKLTEYQNFHAKFWTQAKPILEKLPNKCFAPSTSKPSDFKELLKVNETVYI